jgi:hypothetical protein
LETILVVCLNAVNIKIFTDFVIYSRIKLAVETKVAKRDRHTLFGEFAKAKLAAAMSHIESLLD